YLPGGLETTTRKKSYRSFTHAFDMEVLFNNQPCKLAVVARHGQIYLAYDLTPPTIHNELERAFQDAFGHLELDFKITQLTGK
ncbi:hypothetical protein, partial [Enterococcus faecalis]|uniref:hypothetical protein n=1 Tax=Enterococcus faecalis TaxID=1351 RepID=UPI0030C7D735